MKYQAEAKQPSPVVLREATVVWHALVISTLIAEACFAVTSIITLLFARQRLLTTWLSPEALFHAGRTMYVGVPLAAALGASLTLATLRYYGQPAKEGELPWWLRVIWVIFIVVSVFAFVVTLPLFLAVLIQLHLRRQSLLREPLGALVWTAFYTCLLVLGTAVALHAYVSPRASDVVAPLLMALILSIPISDSVMTWRVWRWRQDGVEFAVGRGLQFSLSTLMVVTVILGAWVSGLVLMFGEA